MIKGKLRISKFYSGDDYSPIGILSAYCSACDFEHGFRVDLEGHGKWSEEQSPWTFDGNYDNPTFSPSMLANKNNIDKYHPICHSFLENGKWKYLKDSTHHLAEQTVDMIPPDPDVSFERQHGWHLYPYCDDEGKPK